ncbi:shugoshin [Hirsutella rhossiliensis]|uniref:Shugoshin n=1 Tax=Hirsutella rhossiliensis TaxID=111463 RepID=A0A9P8N3U5_9HYPO|nr:shugoshin [Hirsutella rhossiliensis]KAH0966405.1 shugoshin [Hirsutella rhossiliensis]
MARLNEPPVSSDSIETLRRKMLRQNRDLAKSNNVRALRIRELENECACMLSENLELRSRILELEKQVQDNDARRIADHALAIKAKLESQLTEWGTLLAGLGLEPPIKRHSPRISKSTRQRMSFSANRPSPSQRRLRDVARDIEELGHISETKSCPRRSMNPEQILALRSEVDSTHSPELGPPPMSKFIDEDPVKAYSPYVDSTQVSKAAESPPPSPSPSPKVMMPPLVTQQSNSQPGTPAEPVAVQQPVRTGSKRKFGVREDIENIPMQPTADENQVPKVITEKPSVQDKADGKNLKELAYIRKDVRERKGVNYGARKPLAAKSTNDGIRSPWKMGKPTAKAKISPSIEVEAAPELEIPPPSTTEPTVRLSEPTLLLPSSPEPISGDNTHRGDTPPPADISSSGETTRPGRRNRAAISYAEPNLRDKMRRPSKQLYDAVAGEGKYSRRSSSQAETPGPDPQQVKRESPAGESWRSLPAASAQTVAPEGDGTPQSPLAGKSSSPQHTLPDTVVTDRRRRPSSMSSRAPEPADEGTKGDEVDASTNADTSGAGDVDIYEFTSSSPHTEKEEAVESKRTSRRQTVSSRRVSTAIDSDNGDGTRERNSARRRSMLV